MEPVETELHDAAEDFLFQLRMKMKFDPSAAECLKAALRAAAEAWAGRATISKSAANLFVDLESATLSCATLFTVEQRETVRYLADELAGLVRQCVTEPSRAP